jgi:UDP-N-acetylmuramoyl-L-alanyl-D-glutamate--2,6-diaminopimelate ligase
VQLQEVLSGLDVVAFRGDARVDVAQLTHDSRQVEPGACFACVVGADDDGHDHAPAARDAGAVALLVERPLGLGITEAEVADVRRALGPAASTLHGHPSRAMRCLGVTGTNGKTTTTYLVEAIARAAGARAGMVGTTGARIDGEPVPLAHTTPEATELQALLARMRDRGIDTVAMEVSSHALVQRRVDGIWFAAVAFTNLSHDHLDFHGSVAAYFEAKASLFDPSRAASAVVNVDDAYGVELALRVRELGLPLMTFGINDEHADMTAESLRLDTDGSRFLLCDRRTDLRDDVHLGLLGQGNVSNALAAAALALTSGMSFQHVVAGLGAGIVVPGRLEPVSSGQPFTVLVDYAHTPAALESALSTARELAGGRRVVVVFGCGGDRDADKRPKMGRAAVEGADVVVVTSDNPRSEAPEAIAAAVVEGARGAPVQPVVELDRRAAIRLALDEAAPGDVVVIAGKGHETGQTTAGRTIPFDDRVVAREELGARAWS